MMARKKNARRSAKTNCNKISRRLFIIDIENYCGKPVLSEADVEAAKTDIAERFNVSSDDLVVIGTSHTSNLASAGFVWRGARQVIMPGHDGADLALLKAVEEYRIESFAEVVIMSGDGIFASLAERLAQTGVAVSVASLGRCLSAKLAAVATQVSVVSEPVAA